MYSKHRNTRESVFSRGRLRDQIELRAIPDGVPVTIRPAYPDDALALARLADLDDGLVPRGSVLVAEVGGELWAAASLDGRDAVADPFQPSAGLLRALRSRARRTRDDGRRARRRRERRRRRGGERGPGRERERER